MEAVFFKNIKTQPHKSPKPIACEETKSSTRITANGDAKVSQSAETSERLASLTYVSSRGFFFH